VNLVELESLAEGQCRGKRAEKEVMQKLK